MTFLAPVCRTQTLVVATRAGTRGGWCLTGGVWVIVLQNREVPSSVIAQELWGKELKSFSRWEFMKHFALRASPESTTKGRCPQTVLFSRGFIKICMWVTPGLGPRSWRVWISCAWAQLSPHPPVCKARSYHYCSLCHLSPPTNPFHDCWLKAESPWANNCYLKLYFLFFSRCFVSFLSQTISLCFGKAWTSDLWSTQSNKASRQRSDTSGNILR